MRDSLSSVFSYLFMAAVIICIISLFGALIIFMRSFTMDIGGLERQTGFAFLYVFISCVIAAPIFHYISTKLEKNTRGTDGY
jgi:hypothetical protein